MFFFVLLFIVGALFVAVFLFLLMGKVQEVEKIVWGVNFSKKHAENLGLNWKAAYTALFDELEVKRLKISLDWDELEPQKDMLFFDDGDWQIAEAEKRGVKLLLVVGMKTMRWPECHLPKWVIGLSKKEQQKEILELLEEIVKRYKNSSAVWAWHVENEPLLPFGECPWRDRKFLKKEVELVKSLDPNHPVIISDSGEFSFWVQSARIGDIVSTTMYRKVWFGEIGRYVKYPLPPVFYGRKAQLIKTLFGKDVIVGELQAEPWGSGKLLYDTTIEEQNKAFDIAQFRKNIEFAKRTGLSEFYLWGAEWWFWRKEKAGDPTFWDEARSLFNIAD